MGTPDLVEDQIVYSFHAASPNTVLVFVCEGRRAIVIIFYSTPMIRRQCKDNVSTAVGTTKGLFVQHVIPLDGHERVHFLQSS